MPIHQTARARARAAGRAALFSTARYLVVVFFPARRRASLGLVAVLLLGMVPAAAETCIASQYGVGDGYHGRRTASGAIFNTHARDPYTVAMRRPRPLGSWVTVTNLANGRAIRARVTDRGPFVAGRCVDLGRAGAVAIGMGGLARVSVE